jgi:hypothetical protein
VVIAIPSSVFSFGRIPAFEILLEKHPTLSHPWERADAIGRQAFRNPRSFSAARLKEVSCSIDRARARG